jgi:hypothetical protein
MAAPAAIDAVFMLLFKSGSLPIAKEKGGTRCRDRPFFPIEFGRI